MLGRTARYTLAALCACALMVATANATGRVNGAKVESRTSAQKQRKPGPSRGSAPSRTRGTGGTREAESARWRTGRRRPCGKRCR